MLFNSLSFAIFFPIVFILYWFVTKKKLVWQNMLLLVSSYFFLCLLGLAFFIPPGIFHPAGLLYGPENV